MKQQNGQLTTITKVVLSILLILGLMLGIAGLNILVQNHTTVSERENQQQATRLDIALVNEDKPVVVGENSYNLGASYIKNIERDESHNWSVVSRGTADSGLAAGDYQLIIYIPSDFSSKILDVDNPVVEKTKVTYKVNANGNLQVENEANQVAKDIVAGLNSQLVDMYIASILSNLYSAQQNVKAVAETKGQNIQTFETSLYTTSQAFPSAFPSLVTISNSAVNSNSTLVSSLSAYSTLYSGLQTNQTSFETSLSELIEQRASNNVSYGSFMEALMGMEGKVLSQETTEMMTQLEVQQTQLVNAIGQPADIDSGQEATAYTKSVAEIEENIHVLLTQMETSQANLKSRIANVDVTAEEILKSAYNGKANLDEITVRDILSDGGFSINAENYTNQMNQLMQTAVNRLPNLDASVYASKLNAAGQEKFSAITSYDAGLAGNYQANYVPNTSLDARLNQAIATLNEKKTAYSTVSPVKQTVEITVVNQTNLPVTSWTIINETLGTSETKAAGETAIIDLSHRVHFDFNFELPTTSSTTQSTTTSPTDPANSGQTTTTTPTTTTSNSGPVRIITLTGKEIAATSNTVEEEYRQAYGAYMEVAQEVVDVYNHTGQLLSGYYTNGVSLTDQFLNQSAKTYLLGLIKKSIVASLGSYQEDVENDVALTNSINALKEKQGRLTTDLATIRATNLELSGRVTEAIALLNTLKQDLGTIRSLESSYNQASSQSDTALSNLGTQLQSLMSTTQGVAESSEANIKQAESVNEIFTSFNQATEDAKASADNLSSEADKLLSQFRDELDATQSFAASFETVFANAYANGVPNEVLLDFMSSPVVSEASSVKATANAYRPFTWILLLEIISLFTAYIFATHNLIKKVEDKFKTSRWVHTDVANTLVLSVISLVIGMIVGVLSSQQLQVESGQVPSWVFLLVLFSFVLVHGQYFLLKNLKSVGMGIALYTIVSFVYLSSALGTTASLSGLPAVLKSLNVLSILEQQLFAYFDGVTVSLGVVGVLLVVILLLVAGNIFISMDNFLARIKTEETHV